MFQAGFGIKLEKTTKVTARQEFVRFTTSWQQPEMVSSGDQSKQFDPGG